MDRESELQRLEKFVEKILARFSALKAEKMQLDQDLAARNQLIEELQGTIASKVTERNEISERVNKIVDQIEDWELTLDETAMEDDSIDAAIDDEDTDEDYAHAEEKEAAAAMDEDEKRVQHDLFSMAGSRK